MLRRWIWRRSLDFWAIRDIHSIKRQIAAHKGHRVKAVAGHDLKLGRGGIREIEFFCQTQQLIFGGRDPALREPVIPRALTALAAAGLIENGESARLDAAYRFLRRAEHRLQMIDDRQTHTLPDDPAALENFALFLGHGSAEEFSAELMEHLGAVEDSYAGLFEEQPSLSAPGNLVFTGTEDDPETLATLTRLHFTEPSTVAALVRNWHRGRYRATRSDRARQILTELVPGLLSAFGASAQPDRALSEFDSFLSRLPTGVPLFSLLEANPDLLSLLAEILGAAPGLAETLAARPELFEALVEPGFWEALPDAPRLSASLARRLDGARDHQDILEAARRWAAEQRFRAGLHLFKRISPLESCAACLSDIADAALSALLPAVTAEFESSHGGFAGMNPEDSGLVLLALGKYGGREMSVGSDLDLILVYDLPGLDLATAESDGPRPLSAGAYFTKLAQRLIAAVSAPMAEGRLYEIDTRLRPSGRKGPLATSLPAFSAYQADGGAWTWEHMALTRARCVTGPGSLSRRILSRVAETLRASRDPETLRRDVVSMRRRLEKEHRDPPLWTIKHVPGGLVDVEFAAQYLTLRDAQKLPRLPLPAIADTFQALAEAGSLSADAAEQLALAHKTWRRLQAWQRLLGNDGLDLDGAPAPLRDGLGTAIFGEALGFEEAKSRLSALAAATRKLTEEILSA
jgi:glutamate-ammonia-ligase adenylyltransferase